MNEPSAWAVEYRFTKPASSLAWKIDRLYQSKGTAKRRAAYFARYDETQARVVPLYASPPRAVNALIEAARAIDAGSWALPRAPHLIALRSQRKEEHET